MKKRVLHVTAVAVAASLVVAFLLAIPLMLRVYLGSLRQDLKDLLYLLGENQAYALQAPGEFAQEYGRVLSIQGRQIRISILTADGAVRGDSGTPEQITENHAARDEIQSAVADTWGFAMRKSQVTGKVYYYAAYYDGVVVYRAAVEAESLLPTLGLICLCGVVGAVAGMLVAAALSHYLAARSVRDVRRLAQAAEQAAAGDLTVRAPVGEENGELRDIGNAVNTMTRTLREQNRALTAANAAMHAVLQGMKDGVIAVQEDLDTIMLLTGHMRRILGGEPGQEKRLTSCGANYGYVLDVLREAAQQKAPAERSFTICTPQEKHVCVWAAPLRQTGGALAVVSDVTRLRTLEKLRSEFAANVTHELKTPLTSIRGYVELLRGGGRDAQTCAQFYEIIEIEAQRLANLIDDLLELANIEQAAAPPYNAVADVKRVADRVADRLHPIAKKACITLHMDVAAGLYAAVSETHLAQLLTNLADNAVKYNRPGGTVALRAVRERGVVALCVTDTGLGIPADSLDRIFERFYRVDKGRSRELGGTGLGLSIVKHIVGLYGGDVQVDSIEGEGAAFTVRLPLAQPPQEQPE